MRWCTSGALVFSPHASHLPPARCFARYLVLESKANHSSPLNGEDSGSKNESKSVSMVSTTGVSLPTVYPLLLGAR